MTAAGEQPAPVIVGVTRVWVWQHYCRTGTFNQRTLSVENPHEAWVTVSRSYASKDEALRNRAIRMKHQPERLVCRETTVTDRVVPYDDPWADTSPVDAGLPVKRPAAEWCERLGYVIADRDGWRHKMALPWDTPITETDFLHRVRMSTVLRSPHTAAGQ